MKSPFSPYILAFGLLWSVFAASARAEDKTPALAIIVNPSNKMDGTTAKELQRYFKAEKSKTPEGLKLIIVMQEAGRPERDAALKNIYKMNEAQYTNYFVEATFTGAVANAPKSLSNVALKKFVATTPGAIGYVRSTDVDESVKVLKIDGKSIDEPDYLLREQ